MDNAEELLQLLLARTQQRNDKIFIVPVNTSLSLSGPKSRVRSFIESHVFMTSPYFRDVYSSLSGLYSFKVDFNSQCINCNDRKISIISQEKNTLEDGGSYRVFYIENALNDANEEMNREGLERELIITDPSAVLKQREWLSEKCPGALEEVDSKAAQFCKSFIVVPGYYHDASKRLNSVLVGVYQEHVEKLGGAGTEEADSVMELIENVLMEQTAEFILTNLVEIFKAQDVKTHELLVRYKSHVSRHGIVDLGMKRGLEGVQIFLEPLSKSFAEILHTSAKNYWPTPMMMRHSCSTAISRILSAAQEFAQVTALADPDMILAADDLLPLTALLLILSTPKHLWTALVYMKDFRLTDIMHPQIEYSYTTLEAAFRYLKSDPLNLMQDLSSPIGSPRLQVNNSAPAAFEATSTIGHIPSAGNASIPAESSKLSPTRSIRRPQPAINQPTHQINLPLPRTRKSADKGDFLRELQDLEDGMSSQRLQNPRNNI